MMEVREGSLPQFPHTGSCSSPREIPAGIQRRYCRSYNKHGVVTRAGGGDPQPCLNFPMAGARGAPCPAEPPVASQKVAVSAQKFAPREPRGATKGAPTPPRCHGDGHGPLRTPQIPSAPPDPSVRFPPSTLPSPLCTPQHYRSPVGVMSVSVLSPSVHGRGWWHRGEEVAPRGGSGTAGRRWHRVFPSLSPRQGGRRCFLVRDSSRWHTCLHNCRRGRACACVLTRSCRRASSTRPPSRTLARPPVHTLAQLHVCPSHKRALGCGWHRSLAHASGFGCHTLVCLHDCACMAARSEPRGPAAPRAFALAQAHAAGSRLARSPRDVTSPAGQRARASSGGCCQQRRGTWGPPRRGLGPPERVKGGAREARPSAAPLVSHPRYILCSSPSLGRSGVTSCAGAQRALAPSGPGPAGVG